jgi:DNA-directed RNA polymerase specialized sigma24 family protein
MHEERKASGNDLINPVLEHDLEKVTDHRLIAALRIMARSYRPHSAESADDLVELTFEIAIDEVDRRPEQISLFEWLSGIMARHHN